MNLLILLLVELFLFVLAFWLSEWDIMAPSVFMCIVFIISTIGAVLNIHYWNIEFSIKSLLIIVLGLCCFIFSEIFFRYTFCRQLHGQKRHIILSNKIYVVSTKSLNILILVNSIICIIVLKKIMLGTGASSILESFAIYRMMGISNMLGEGENLLSSIYVQLTIPVIAVGYMSCYLFVQDVIYKIGPLCNRMRYIILMLLSILPSMFSGGRSGILKLFSASAILYYIVWHQKNGWNRNLSWRYIRYGIISMIIGIPAFFFLLNLVGRSTEGVNMFDYVSTYISSSIIMFDQYVQSPIPCKIIGEESLFSVIKVLNYLGLSQSSYSYNLEYRPIGNGYSNVYTFFRRPLHDFGLFGMCVFTILVSFLFSYIYFKKIKFKESQRSILWVLLYGYLYYWIMISSILQYSQAYISIGTIKIVLVIFILFRVLTKQMIVPAKAKCMYMNLNYK